MALKKEIGKKDVTFVTLLKYLSSRLPKDVYLKDIEFTDRNRRFELASTNLSRDLSNKEGAGLKETAKGATKEDTGMGASPSTGTIQPPGQSTEAIPPSEPDYIVTIRGYIFGDIEVIEPTLLNLVISLEQSTIVRGIEVSKKEVKEVQGKKAMEFVIIGQCTNYEI
jgi:hypothetical protein